MTPWYIAQAVLALIALAALGRMVQHDARISRIRRRENAATLAWIATQADLDTAKAEARDVIDQHLAETPLYVETCEAEAARIAAAELDDDLARMFGGGAMTAWYACADCGTAMHERAELCLECYRDRQALARQRDEEWWSE